MRLRLHIDERASPEQREALSAIFSFKPGGAFAAQARLVAEVLGVKFVPITFEGQGRQWKMTSLESGMLTSLRSRGSAARRSASRTC